MRFQAHHAAHFVFGTLKAATGALLVVIVASCASIPPSGPPAPVYIAPSR